MSEQNKAIARRFYEDVFNRKNLNAIDEICSPTIVDHSAMPGQAPGAKGMKDMFGVFVRAFPDLKVTVEEMVSERDLVVARISVVATHTGELFGTAATNRRVTFHGIDM